MLDLLLAAHDGGTSWRQLLEPGEARAGLECVGPAGLARRIGRVLGVPAQPAEAPRRLAALATKLDQHDDGNRSYSASRKHDPFGVVRFLLALRDALRMAGWDGRGLTGSPRLRDLAELEHLGIRLPAGLPDVLADLVAALKGPLPFPVRVQLAAPRSAFMPMVLALVDALTAAEAAVTDMASEIAQASAGTDLGCVQRALLTGGNSKDRPTLKGDGSFLVLEADTPVEAAELTASLARTLTFGDTTVVVNTEAAVLDAALARQGLPTVGLPSSSALRPHLQVLPLRLQLAFKPQDPFRAAELLLLPGGPLPGHARRSLLNALNEMPGVGSPKWLDATKEILAEETARAEARGDSRVQAESAAKSLSDRLAAWFGGDLHDPVAGIPAVRAAEFCVLVSKWAGGRTMDAAERADKGDDPGASDDAQLWAQAAAVARTLEQMLLARPLGERLPQQTLMQLHDLAVGNGSDLATFNQDAGRPAVARGPGEVVASSPNVIWWGCSHDADQGSTPEPWTEAEGTALRTAGVTLPAPGERREVESAEWRRPILAARRCAVLVRWRLAGAEPTAAHAFFDELDTWVAPGALASCTITSERLLASGACPAWQPATTLVPPDAPMVQRPVWTVPAATVVPTRDVSASSLETFLGCPFRWALHYQALLQPGRGVDLPDGERLTGDFAHRILQDMLCGDEKLDVAKNTENDARTWALNAFDDHVATEAAPLVRRGAEVDRDRVRTLIGNAAAALVRVLKQGGWRPVEAERKVSGTFAGISASGRVDLVVAKGSREALVDLKLGGLKYKREALETGHAIQLALYAAMMKGSAKALPSSGYFILEDGQLLTTDPTAFPGATVVSGPSADDTLAAAEKGFDYWKQVLSKGLLPAMLNDLAWVAPVTKAAGPPPDEGSSARYEAGCRFCNFATICVAPAIEEVES
jgi:hypothetical protein